MAKNMVTIIEPEIIKWAHTRTETSAEQFAKKMQVSVEKVHAWESGTCPITMAQAKRLSSVALLPLGALFLKKVPNRKLRLPDFRSINSQHVVNPSPELEATVLEMQEKQDWYREILLDNGQEPLAYVGSISLETPHAEAVQKIHEVLVLPKNQVGNGIRWEQYSRTLAQKIEDAGITLIRNGVVGNNTQRPLDVEEFRGFVLVDSIAPLIFINGQDSKNAQMFTLIHELVHILLGTSGIIDVGFLKKSSNATEKYCNQVAADFLVPEDKFKSEWHVLSKTSENIWQCISLLAKKFTVSSLVIINRCRDFRLISPDVAARMWVEEIDRIKQYTRRTAGGDFFATLKYRVGINFAKTVITETIAHNIPYSDAFRLLHVKNAEALNKLSHEIGFPGL